MSLSSTNSDVDDLESNCDQCLSDSDSRPASESSLDSGEIGKPTLVCAEKIWQFPVSSEYSSDYKHVICRTETSIAN